MFAHMKSILAGTFVLVSVCMMNCLIVFSQTNACENQLDTARVIKIAKKHNAYWTDVWYAQPSIKFDEASCTWTIVSIKLRHINKWNCKNTNGCTEVKSITLVIDAKTKKVKSKDKTVELYPNYE